MMRPKRHPRDSVSSPPPSLELGEFNFASLARAPLKHFNRQYQLVEWTLARSFASTDRFVCMFTIALAFSMRFKTEKEGESRSILSSAEARR